MPLEELTFERPFAGAVFFLNFSAKKGVYLSVKKKEVKSHLLLLDLE